MRGSGKKRRTSIFAYFRQKGQFWPVFGQNGQNGENYQKSAWKIFLKLTSPNCKVSEKSNERFPRKKVTHGRNNTPKVLNDCWSRDQKHNDRLVTILLNEEIKVL